MFRVIVAGSRNITSKDLIFKKLDWIIVSSQMGVPIGVYQGKDVYVSVPDDLPKTTHLSIDGKSLYIHRANYTILDADMLEE